MNPSFPSGSPLLPLTIVALVSSAILHGQSVIPTTPPSDGITVTAGDWKSADGSTVKLPAATLKVSAPEIRKLEKSGDIPVNYLPRFESFDMWPADKGTPGPLNLSPARSDHGNTQILGGLYRQLVPGSLTLQSEDGSKTFKEGEDFKLHPTWPQVTNLSDRLGKPGSGKLKASYGIATQRLDLLQLKDGTLTIKPGKSYLVCPVLPEPDAGATAIAGIYVAPWQTDGKHVVSKEDIFPIRAFTPAPPVNPDGIAKSAAKLKGGEPLKIAFMGDSVTLGAEATAWTLNLWTEKNLTYASRVVTGLRKAFPSAKIEPIQAVQGGTTSKVAPQFFDEKVAPQKPDLLLIAFGLNDANSTIGGKPRVPVEEYKEGLRGVIGKARAIGTEVILVTPMQPGPFLKSGIATRIADYRDAMLALAKEEKVACADVYADWMHQADRGIPPFSQLHNWINHPGNHGHGVYADTILRFFTPGGAVKKETSAVPAIGLPQPDAESPLWRTKPRELPSAQEIAAKARPNAKIYGLYSWWNEYKARRSALKEVGWKSIRLGGPLTDEAMTALAEDGVEVLHTFGAPRFDHAKDGGKEDEYVVRYVAAFTEKLRRYGPGGSFFKDHPEVPNRPIIHWEICNEPNFQYLVPPDGRPNKELEAFRENIYAKLLIAAHQAAKLVSDQIKVVGFSTGGVSAGDLRFIKNVHTVDAGVARSYDILATHPYVDPAPPEGFSIQKWGDYSISTNLATIRKNLAQHQRGDAPIWYTEMGWEIPQEEGGRFPGKRAGSVTSNLQAACIVRNYALAMRLGVERVHVMFIHDSDQYNGGFFNRNGTWRPSAHAVKTMVSILPEPKFLDAIHEGEEDTYAYRFAPTSSASGKPVIMAWNIKGPATARIPFPSAHAVVTDMLGGKSTVAAEGGFLVLPIGPLPVYVTEQ
ncbi:SGNH/GDSL hydrolase family protein [Luteolibacter sp. SL250]|uniref:SGNH/GDSL hydrolase family protein n=1 Tax=Luteolibacter sp. SL250 TaxID=2995170 RepID=UPI0022708DB0|nr:SGNH/GDSL hydrolase family protein [Luteolibacter sp. SL250]WAC21234.1 SGNH/GDSL hydrolase family protein [Luteolibacter sp. SL250]